MFSSLFDKVPAKRAGNEHDIAGAVLYLVSRAGVRSPLLLLQHFGHDSFDANTNGYRLTSTGCRFVSTAVVSFLLTARSEAQAL